LHGERIRAREGTPQTGVNHIGPLPSLHAAFDNLGIKPKAELVWTAAAASLAGDYTVIDNPATNNNPNAVVQVTHSWAGIFDDHALGVWYTGARWAIFHQDLTAIPTNAQYNVVVNDGFVHRATAANTSSYITTIDNFGPFGKYDTKNTGVWSAAAPGACTTRMPVRWSRTPRSMCSSPTRRARPGDASRCLGACRGLATTVITSVVQ
jgi:hypothetical protein